MVETSPLLRTATVYATTKPELTKNFQPAPTYTIHSKVSLVGRNILIILISSEYRNIASQYALV